jgi:ribosomal protein S27E
VTDTVTVICGCGERYQYAASAPLMEAVCPSCGYVGPHPTGGIAFGERETPFGRVEDEGEAE